MTILTQINTLLCTHLDKTNNQKIKRAISGQALIGFHGIQGDHGDAEHYADPDNALLHYAFDHYAYWQQQLPAARALLEAPGAFSENLSSLGVTEENMCIGDILQLGTARIQVSFGRDACNTMVERFQHASMNQEMHRTCKMGWFYRVLEEGSAQAGDDLILLERPNPQWTVAQVATHLYGGELQPKILEQLVAIPYLAKAWKDCFASRLETGVVEKVY